METSALLETVVIFISGAGFGGLALYLYMKEKLQKLHNQTALRRINMLEQVAIAESKLLLLGEQKLEKALKLYTTKMAQFRKQIYPGRFNSIEEASGLKKEVSQMREQFYNVLSQRYDQRIG
jgi:hypothetical protein